MNPAPATPSFDSKLADLPAAMQRVAAARAAGQTVVFTNGCFDLLHLGHAKLLHDARAQGDFLIVAINSDSSVRRLKGKHRPIVPQHERALLLAALGSVDLVIIFDDDEPIPLLQALHPDVLVKGGDYTPDTVVGRDLVEGYGGRVKVVPLHPGLSTTEIIRRITACE